MANVPGMLPTPEDSAPSPAVTGAVTTGFNQFAAGGEVGGDPMDVIQQALQFGRQQFRLPPQFFGGEEEPAEPVQEAEPMEFAEGGMIPTGGEPSQDQGQGFDQQAALQYLSGAGAAGPEIIAALEQQVDPQGQMDPSQRSLLAVQAAGSPDRAFGVMQHYRQQFNGLTAFAKAALQGAGGRPPNPASAADALNKAYSQVPDGKNVRFIPAQGGFQISIGGGSEEEPEPQQFAEGGLVEDDEEANGTRETVPLGQSSMGEDPDEGVVPMGQSRPEEDQRGRAAAKAFRERGAAGSLAAAPGAIHDAVKEQGAGGALKEFFMSIPQFVKWLATDGQFDSALEKGIENTIPADSGAGGEPMVPGAPQAAMAPPPMPMQQPQPVDQSAFPDAPGSRGSLPQPRQGQQPQGGQSPFPDAPRPKMAADWRTPTSPQSIKQVAHEAAQEPTLKDVLNEINLAFPYQGQEQQKALARAHAIQEWNKNQVSIKREGVRNEAFAGRTSDTNASRERIASMQVSGRQDVAASQDRARAERQLASMHNKEQIERLKQTGQWDRMVQQETEKFKRAVVVGTGNVNKVAPAMEKYQGVPRQAPNAGQAPAATPPAQATQSQLPPAAVAALKEGQVTTFKNGQKWTLQGGKPVQVP